MDFELNEEQRMTQKMVRDFAAKDVAPIAAHVDEVGEVPIENVRKMAEMGLMGFTISEEYGGCGGDNLSYVLAVEEMSKVCAATAVVMAVQEALVCRPLELYGSEEQKQKYLVPLATGELIGAFALTEPGAGCDASAVATTALSDGDEYVINGTKHFITNGGIADVVLLLAKTDPKRGSRGISAIIVEKGTPGFTAGKKEEKMGIRGSNTSELIFQDCRVPKANLLGKEGRGYIMALTMLDGGRVGVAAQAVGIAQAAYEEALKYSKVREQFGKPISQFQAIQWMLADMATRIEAARLLTYRAAVAKDEAKASGKRFSKEAAMAKLFASETAVWVTNRAVQIHGGYGYMKDYPVERYFRDAKITEIYEGTSEVQRMVIAGWELR